MIKPITHASLFSGIGGPEVAAAMLGWENVFHCEINPFGKAVLEYWFPNSQSYEDITKTDFRPWRGRVHVLTGGFPCQPFSYAGRRGGREDERYLWPEMLRAINEIRPTWVVGENVAGITTMVEGGVCTEMGSESSLFGEGDCVHRYELQQAFTIERICRDLERLGYSVQPMLIPAAAVGAPHRRDRIFILAYDAHSYRGDDLRGPGEDAGEGGEERLQEWNEVREPGEPNNLRRDATNTMRKDLQGQDYETKERQRKISDRPIGFSCRPWNVTDTYSNRYSAQEASNGVEGEGRTNNGQPGKRIQQTKRVERFYQFLQYGREYKCGDRWANFPTIPPIHRGNDGLPFDVDNLTIPFSKWRTESLKAYGNAIVPQVMYEIFLQIQNL